MLYSKFAKALVIITGIIAAAIAIPVAFSHVLGFCFSIIIFLIWGGAVKLIAFMFEPEYFLTYSGENDDELPELKEPKDRIIREDDSNVWRGLKQEKPSEEWKREREEREFAEMHRVL